MTSKQFDDAVVSKGVSRRDFIMAEEGPSGNPASIGDVLGGVYGLGVFAVTLIEHQTSGWLSSFGYGLIWPIFIPVWFLHLRTLYYGR